MKLGKIWDVQLLILPGQSLPGQDSKWSGALCKPEELGSWNFERMVIPQYLSYVMSHVMCHMFFFQYKKGTKGWSYWWRVCYQRGLPSLVLETVDVGNLWIVWLLGSIAIMPLIWFHSSNISSSVSKGAVLSASRSNSCSSVSQGAVPFVCSSKISNSIIEVHYHLPAVPTVAVMSVRVQ